MSTDEGSIPRGPNPSIAEWKKFFHDCGHGSFFRSRLANDVTGFVAGMLTFTPYYHWRYHQSHPLFRGVKAVKLWSSFGATRFRLWDERLRKLVGFRHLKELRSRAKRAETKDPVD